MRQQGFSLVELIVSVAIIGMASALIVPVAADSIRKGRGAALQQDGKTIYDALMNYYNDNSAFPSDDSFDTTTLAPLSDEGYLRSGEAITGKLAGGELMVYLAPDVGGEDQQFVLVMRHADDPQVLVGVVHTNLVTEDGDWVDGSYVIDQEDIDDAGLGDDDGGDS